MNHETEFRLKQAKESKANGSRFFTSESLDIEAPQFEGHASRDSTFLVPGYVHADRGKSKGNGRVPPSEQFQPPVREIDFTELEDGSLVELVEDPSDSGRTLLAVYKDGQVSYTGRLEHEGQVLVPLQREKALLKHVKLARSARAYESVLELLREVEFLIGRCVVLDGGLSSVLANFVLSTWLVDRLPVAPYVAVVGQPQSGKTILLQVLSLVCRRSLLTADLTSAAFYEACNRLTPTLLVDEAGTHNNSRTLYHLLRVGTTRDVVAMRKGRTFHAYGAKVVCFLEAPDDPALNSRCVVVPMFETRSRLCKPTDPEIEELAANLRDRLLRFRFDTYKRVRIPEIPGSEELRPRARDLLGCLAAPSFEDRERCQFLLSFFELEHAVGQEPLSPAGNAVLAGLFYVFHSVGEVSDSATVYVRDLTRVANNLLAESGERLRLQPRKVGSVLTSLGFTSRQRTNGGWVVWLDSWEQVLIHELAKRHGIDHLPFRLRGIPPESCRLCQETGENPDPMQVRSRFGDRLVHEHMRKS